MSLVRLSSADPPTLNLIDLISFAPNSRQPKCRQSTRPHTQPEQGNSRVGLPGFEPGTSASRTQRANQAAPQPVRPPGGAASHITPASARRFPAPVGRRIAAALVGVPPGPAPASPPAKVATTCATRRLSISTTLRSQSPTRTSSPSVGMWPKRSKRSPPRVTYSPSGIVDAQALPHVVDVGLPVDQPAGVVDPDDERLLLLVELVVEVADERLQEILDGQHAGDAAVLVDHHGDRPAVLAHVGQRLEDPERLGQQVGLAHLARDLQGAGVGRVPVARLVPVAVRPGLGPPPVRKMSLTKRMPIRSSRSSWTTGKQLCPEVRTARAMSSAWTGMVRYVTSTRGVITSRTSMSLRSARASVMIRSCSDASASSGCRAGPSPSADRRHGRRDRLGGC